jgi:hypothetical protein
MSPKKAKILKTVRGIDLTLRYTSDNLVDSLINQRQFFDQDKIALAPVTPKLLERQVQPSTPSISRLVAIDPRFVKVCFGSVANVSGESNFQIIIPYAPGDAGHKEHLREIFAYVSSSANINPSTALNVSYYGENKN